MLLQAGLFDGMDESNGAEDIRLDVISESKVFKDKTLGKGSGP